MKYGSITTICTDFDILPGVSKEFLGKWCVTEVIYLDNGDFCFGETKHFDTRKEVDAFIEEIKRKNLSEQ